MEVNTLYETETENALIYVKKSYYNNVYILVEVDGQEISLIIGNNITKEKLIRQLKTALHKLEEN